MIAYKVFIERNKRIYSTYKHILDYQKKSLIWYAKTRWNDRNNSDLFIKNSGPFCAFDNLDTVHSFLVCHAKYNEIYSVYQIECERSLERCVWENYNDGKYAVITHINELSPGTILIDSFKIIKLIYQTTGWELSGKYDYFRE